MCIGMGWHWLNLITTIGAFVFAIGVIMLIVNVAISLKGGRLAGANPWDAATLEWAIPSPPPAYNFAVIPTVVSRHPLWENRLRESEEHCSTTECLVLDQGRETIGTTPLDGEPEQILRMPGDSFAPFVLTIGMMAGFIGLLLHLWWLSGAGGFVMIVAVIVWLWPERALGQIASADYV